MASPDIGGAAGSEGGPIPDSSILHNNGQLQQQANIPALPPLIRIDSIRKQSSEAEKSLPVTESFGSILTEGAEDDGNPVWIGGAPTMLKTLVEGLGQASDSEIEHAVLQVVQVFSKPEPDRQRLFRAVLGAVKGETTIKEAATMYYFATSTMHPYVHRAREILGDRAPPMKSSRTGMVLSNRGRFKDRPKETPKIPAHLQNLKPLSTNVSEFLKNSFTMHSFTNPDTIRLRMESEAYPNNSGVEVVSNLPIECLPVESSTFDGGKILTEDSLQINGGGSPEGNSLLENDNDAMILTSQDRLQTNNSSFYSDTSADEILPIESTNSEEPINDVPDCSPANSLKEAQNFEGSLVQVDTAEDAAREVIQKSQIPESASMGLFLSLVRCLNGEMSPREAALSLDMPPAAVSSLMERAKQLLPSEFTAGLSKGEMCLEEMVDKSIRGSHYYGESKERLHQAVMQTIRGDLPLTQAAARHDIPFSTLHPYVKRARVLMNGPSITSTPPSNNHSDQSSFFWEDDSPSMVKDYKRMQVPGIVASGFSSSPVSPKVTSIALGSKIGGGGSPKPPKPRSSGVSGGSRGKFQDGMLELSTLPPEVVRMAVERAVQSCQYDNPLKKQRLSSAVLEALSGSKTMKAAAATHEVPFTTLQTYFHRSKAQIQREVANLKLGGESPTNQTNENSFGSMGTGQTKASNNSFLSLNLSCDTSNAEGRIGIEEDKEIPSDHRMKPQKRPWSNAESLWSKLKERQDQAQMEMDIKVEEVLSRNSTPKASVTSEDGIKREVSEETEDPLLPQDIKEEADPEEDVKMNIEIPPEDQNQGESLSLENKNPASSPTEGGSSSRRKPKRVVRNSLPAPPPESLPSTSSSTPLPDEPNLNSMWLQGDDDKFFGAPQAEEMNDLLNQFWQTLEGSVDIVQPEAPEDSQAGGIRDPSSLLKRPSRNVAEIRKQDEAKLAELLKSASASTLEFHLDVNDAVYRATENSQYDGEQRDRLRQATLCSVSGNCSMKEAARAFDIPLGTLHTYFHRSKNLIEAAKHGLDPLNPDVVSLVNRLGAAGVQIGPKKVKKKEKSLAMQKWEKEIETMEELQDLESTLIQDGEIDMGQLQKVVERVIRNSLYPPEQKERLLNAVTRVISGELTINAAANIYHLPSSTVHPYVHRARAALGKFCPPQAKLTPIAKVAKSPKLQETLAKLQQHFQSTSAAQNAANKAKQNAMATIRNNALASKSTSTPKGEPTGSEQSDPSTANKEEGSRSRRSSTSEQFSNGVNFEDADKVVTELVKTSLYGDEGRQRLYEAILMVITDSANVSEAARTYQIPPSTIQPYVVRARAALNLSVSTNGSPAPLIAPPKVSPAPAPKPAQPRRTTIPAPKIFAAPGNAASDEEVSQVVERVVRNSVNADDRRERLYQAVFAAVSGKSTIKDACTKNSLPASTVHPYVSRARHMLGDRCPQPKIATISGSPAANFYKSSIQIVQGPRNQPSTTSTPRSTDQETPMNDTLSNGEKELPTLIVLSGATEKENAGRKMLELQLKQILGRYNYRGDRDRLVFAIATVIGEKKTLAQVHEITGIAQTTLSTYVRIARMFVKESGFHVDEMEGDIGSAVKQSPDHERNSFLQSPGDSPPDSTAVKKEEMEASHSPPPSVSLEVKEESPLSVNPTLLATPVIQPVIIQRSGPMVSPSSGGSKRKSLPNATMELLKLGGRTEEEMERKVKSAIQYTVSVQYKQNQQAKRQLMDAIEDVMLRGIDITVAIGENQGVITQFVIEKFIDRVEKGVEILGNYLAELYSTAAGLPEEALESSSSLSGDLDETPSKRRKLSGVVVEDSMSPTRTSRRLLEKQKAEVEAEGKFSLELEYHLVDFLKKLENINFPMTSEMVLTIANEMLKEHKKVTDEKLGPAWIERMKQKYSFLNIGR